MSATPSIVIGKEGFGIKNGNLLGYYRADDGIYVARQFTATRGGGTNGTFVNSSGLIEVAASPNLPRIDFSSGSKAVLIEPAATNLVLYSETWASGNNWNLTNNVTTVTGTMDTLDPLGTNTANAISPTAVSGSHFLYSNSPANVLYTSGTIYTQTAFFKQGTGAAGRYVQLSFSVSRFTQDGYANFDLQLGEVTVVTGSSADSNRAASIESYGNGWYRCRFTATCDNGGTGVGVIPILITASGDIRIPSFTGVTGDVLYGWGGQVETGAIPTSYIPTTTGSATRAADVCSVSGVSGYIGQTEGTIYAEVDVRQNSLINVQLITLWTTAPNRLQIFIDGNRKIVFQAVLNGSVVFQFTPNDVLTNGIYKIALGYQSGNSALYLNGVSISQSTTTYTVPPCSNINLGSNAGSSAQLNDRLRAAAIYTTRLSNDQLASLTRLT